MRIGVVVLVAACSDPAAIPDAGPADAEDAPPSLTMTLERRDEASGPDTILVTVGVHRGVAAVVGAHVELTATNGAVGAITDGGDGSYRAEVTPAITSGNVALHATALAATIDRIAVVLPAIDAAWGQPEQVPGLVNSAGYEDSSEVSPDGQWLIASSVSPVDLICCFAPTIAACGGSGTALDPAAPVCNDSLGPWLAPERPSFPGASRIISATEIHDELPSLGLVSPVGDVAIALPPTSAFGFHRQSDGSFAEPFSISYAMDGAPGAPFGFTFAQPPAGTAAHLVFAWDDPRTPGGAPADTGNDLYRADVTLGATITLGTFTFDGAIHLTPEPALVPLASRAGMTGNPAVTADGVWFDAEQGDLDLHFAAGDGLGATTLAAPVTVGVSTPNHAEYQPYVHGGRLYYSRDFLAVRSAARGAGNVALAGTWTDDHDELALDGSTAVGAVLAIGEPSLADVGGATELYFVYGVHTATGIDQGVARVRRR